MKKDRDSLFNYLTEIIKHKDEYAAINEKLADKDN